MTRFNKILIRRPRPLIASAAMSLLLVTAIWSAGPTHIVNAFDGLKSVADSKAANHTAASTTYTASNHTVPSSSVGHSAPATQSQQTAVSQTQITKGTPQSVTPVVATVHAATSPSSNSNISSLYVDPTNNAARQARTWMASHGDNQGLQRLLASPMANWYGNWTADVQSATASYVGAAATVSQMPVLVAYNIPNRDCGGQSSGTVVTDAGYSNWIANFAAGIGNRPAIVILEPDAVAASCYSNDRAALLTAAVQKLAGTATRASVYLDAGNSSWQSTSVMAARLAKSGLSNATGFSLNVSNFETTSASISYGTALSQQVGGKHYVIDTSRNGNGSAGSGQYCNPAGRALGQNPTLQTGQPAVDAYLWIKSIGESDGSCGPSQSGSSAPAAGVWWPQYCLALLQNSGW